MYCNLNNTRNANECLKWPTFWHFKLDFVWTVVIKCLSLHLVWKVLMKFWWNLGLFKKYFYYWKKNKTLTITLSVVWEKQWLVGIKIRTNVTKCIKTCPCRLFPTYLLAVFYFINHTHLTMPSPFLPIKITKFISHWMPQSHRHLCLK